MIKYIATKKASVRSNLQDELSSGMLGKIKQNGKVFCGGVSVRMSFLVDVGDEILVQLPERKKNVVQPYFTNLSVCYEDIAVCILEKPSGMDTHCSKKNQSTTLENAYCGLLQSRGEDTVNFTFHAITRLDKETSGLVMVAKNPIYAAKFSKEMKSGNIKKKYLALAKGEIKKDFMVEIPIGRIQEKKPHRWLKESGKHSETLFKIKDKINGDTLVECFPKTGRTHQIRVHLAYVGNPIVGDKLYGCGGILQGEKPKERLMLHMNELKFINAVGEDIVVKSEWQLG